MLRPTQLLFAILLASVLFLTTPGQAGGPHVIQVLATKDNTYQVVGQKKPVITVKAGEVVKLEITAQKGTEWEKDGTIHSFTINALKDQGWNLRLKPGKQEFTLVAPETPGEYVVECTVKCGAGHDDMKTKLVVIP